MLKDKLILWFVLSVCIPIILFIIIIISYQNYLINIEIDKYGDRQIAQLSERLDLFFTQIRSTSRLYFYDDTISDILAKHQNENKEQYMNEQLKLLELQKRHNANMTDTQLEITIITDNSKIYGTGLYNSQVEVADVFKTDWYDKLKENPWEVLWIRDEFLNRLHCQKSLEYIYNVWVLKNLETYEPQGLLIIGFKEADFRNLYQKYLDKQDSLLVYGTEGEVVSSVGNDLFREKEMDNLGKLVKDETGMIQVDHKNYYASTSEIPVPGWKVQILTSQSKLLYEYNNFRNIIYIVFSLYFLIVIVFSFIIAKNIIAPIHTLWKTMDKASQGKLSVRAVVKSNDEIGHLSGSFNALLDEIDVLMNNIIREQDYKRQAEMQSLYAQINPHFIYNTLTSIRYLVYTEEKERVDYVIKSFVVLLKNSISDSGELWTIEKEINLIEKYIEIQQLSFEEPIDVYYEVPEDLKGCRTLKLLLQPIVENAVMHGLKAKKGYKKLQITVEKSGTRVEIRVMDNGIGTAQQLTFEDAEISFDENIGLKNVHSRIELYFGKPYGLMFMSRPAKGTVVTVRLPYIEAEEEFF